MSEGSALFDSSVDITSIAASSETHREGRVLDVTNETCRVELENGRTTEATIALPGYEITPGDRVLVVGRPGGRLWITGVLGASGPRSLTTRSGHRMTMVDHGEDQRLELRDRDDQLLLQIDPATGRVTISAPTGDLALAAPQGHVDLIAGRGIRCAGRDSVVLRAGGTRESSKSSSLHLGRDAAALNGETLELTGCRAEVAVEKTTIVGERMDATLGRARWAIKRVDSAVGRLVERLGTTHRTVEGLQRLTAGRVRTLVRGAYQLRSKQGTITSEEHLKLDGKQIYLG